MAKATAGSIYLKIVSGGFIVDAGGGVSGRNFFGDFFAGIGYAFNDRYSAF